MISNIKPTPWKIAFNPEGNGPYFTKVLLSDLMFIKPDPSDATTWTPRTDTGYKLPHDILLYDPRIYTENGSLDADAELDYRKQYGYFLSKVAYDVRTGNERQWISNNNYKNKISGDPTSGGYYIYDSEASLRALDTDCLHPNITFNAQPLAPGDRLDAEDYYTRSCTVALNNTVAAISSLIVLTNRDTALSATLPGTLLQPYTRIKVSADPNNEEVVSAIKYFTGYGVGDDGNPKVDENNQIIPNADALDPTKNIALQTVEIHIRCSYFADYIDPKSYGQDLHSRAQVQHKNLILGSGNFERYGREATVDNTKPYLPTTPIREDILSKYMTDNNVPTGSFPIPPIDGTYDVATEQATNPIAWIEPTVNTDNDDISHKIPKEGNAYVSGRIFSPTVDELWRYLKKLTSGRNIDENINVGPNAIAKQTNEIDTRLQIEPRFDLVNNKIGDPLDGEGLTYINSGEGIKYQLFDNLIYLSNIIMQGSLQNNLPFEEENKDTNTSINIRNRVAENTIQEVASWNLREQPYSLRELEAMIQNLRYNIEAAFEFTMRNKVNTGHALDGGSLYMLHKDYELDLENITKNTKWESFNDNTQEDESYEYGESLLQSTDGFDYTKDIRKEDVYLSAEGNWRYLFDHVRLPILNEEY